MPEPANAGVVTGQLELNFRMRQKAQPVTNRLGDGDLALARNIHRAQIASEDAWLWRCSAARQMSA